MLEMGRDQKGPFALWTIVILHTNFETDVMKEIWLWFCGFDEIEMLKKNMLGLG